MTEDTNDDMLFGSYEAICKACDASAPVNDLGLCEDCDAKMDRDLIRSGNGTLPPLPSDVQSINVRICAGISLLTTGRRWSS